jgi:hypothetical protein
MTTYFGPKALKIKRGDVLGRVCSNLTAVCWKDKREEYV